MHNRQELSNDSCLEVSHLLFGVSAAVALRNKGREDFSVALTHLSVSVFASGVILFSWLLATSSEFTRTDGSVRTQLEAGTCVGGSVTCSSQRRERARNIARRPYVFPYVCFVFVCKYIYIYSIYSAVVHVSVGVCVQREGDGLELDHARPADVIWWKREDMRRHVGGIRFRRSIKHVLAPERPRSSRVGAFEEPLALIYWRLFEWFSLILYLMLMFYCCDLWNSARANKHPGTGTFTECNVIIGHWRPRDQAHQLPHGVLYCISNNARPGLRGANWVPEVCYFSVLTVDRNYL